MADSTSTGSTGPGISDLLGLLGGSNPLSGISKSMAQFQRGVGQFLESVEKFNDTMDQLNGVATRLNGLLDTIDEPVRAFVPQVTRTIRAADAMVEQLSGPVEKIGPTLTRFADTLSNPTLLSLPTELGAVMQTLGDLAQRLQPLGQLAETAGGWFGLRPLAALRGGGTRPTAPDAAAPERPAPPAPAATRQHAAAPAKKAPAKKAPAKKVQGKKAPAKKAPAKKAPAKKAATKKAAPTTR